MRECSSFAMNPVGRCCGVTRWDIIQLLLMLARTDFDVTCPIMLLCVQILVCFTTVESETCNCEGPSDMLQHKPAAREVRYTAQGQPTWLELCLSMLCLRVSTCLRFCARSSSMILTSLRPLPSTQRIATHCSYIFALHVDTARCTCTEHVFRQAQVRTQLEWQLSLLLENCKAVSALAATPGFDAARADVVSAAAALSSLCCSQL